MNLFISSGCNVETVPLQELELHRKMLWEWPCIPTLWNTCVICLRDDIGTKKYKSTCGGNSSSFCCSVSFLCVFVQFIIMRLWKSGILLSLWQAKIGKWTSNLSCCVFLLPAFLLGVGIHTVCVLLVWERSTLGQLSRELIVRIVFMMWTLRSRRALLKSDPGLSLREWNHVRKLFLLPLERARRSIYLPLRKWMMRLPTKMNLRTCHHSLYCLRSFWRWWLELWPNETLTGRLKCRKSVLRSSSTSDYCTLSHCLHARAFRSFPICTPRCPARWINLSRPASLVPMSLTMPTWWGLNSTVMGCPGLKRCLRVISRPGAASSLSGFYPLSRLGLIC